MRKNYVALLILTITYRPVDCEDYYTAAVLQYNPESDNLLENARNIEIYMTEARDQGADIIITPEYGITSLNASDENNCEISMPSMNISPCDSPTASCPAITALSCAAKRLSIYTAFNIREKEQSTECTSERCPRIFNTYVVLDRNGAIIARHRKYFTFQDDADRPDAVQTSYFDTDFGVRFGIITCFEILFEEPGKTLVDQMNIKNIIFNNAWQSHLPSLTGIQVISGWAHRRNVNLLSAGLVEMGAGVSSSGIFRGQLGMAKTAVEQPSSSKLMVTKLWKDVQGPFISTSETEGVGLVWGTFPGTSAWISKGTMDLIEEAEYDNRVCHRDFCCQFSLSITNYSGDSFFYRAHVFDGCLDFEGQATGGVQTCIVTLCETRNISSCGRKAVANKIISNLTISGDFRANHTLQMPSTLTIADTISPLQPQFFKHKIDCHPDIDVCHNSMTLMQPALHLGTFGIFGRDFTKDGQMADPMEVMEGY